MIRRRLCCAKGGGLHPLYSNFPVGSVTVPGTFHPLPNFNTTLRFRSPINACRLRSYPLQSAALSLQDSQIAITRVPPLTAYPHRPADSRRGYFTFQYSPHPLSRGYITSYPGAPLTWIADLYSIVDSIVSHTECKKVGSLLYVHS